MSHVVLDDYLLRDLLSDESPTALRRILRTRNPATTNLYYLRLCRSVVASTAGALTGSWPDEARRELGRALVRLPDEIRVVSIRVIGFEMAELATNYGLSSLGAEAVASARTLDAPLYVHESNHGPRIHAAADAVGVTYRTVA
jgi:hypothetical protein